MKAHFIRCETATGVTRPGISLTPTATSSPSPTSPAPRFGLMPRKPALLAPLLVEDELAILKMTALMLERMGHAVIAAGRRKPAARRPRPPQADRPQPHAGRDPGAHWRSPGPGFAHGARRRSLSGSPPREWAEDVQRFRRPTSSTGGVPLGCVRNALILLMATCASGGCALLESASTSPPSAQQQSEEVAALQTHVLPLVKNLRVTWYLNEGLLGGSINWKRGAFSTDRARARDEGFQVFDDETTRAYKQFADAISASGVACDRLNESRLADDGAVRFASFQRRGGGITYVFTYIYSPGTRPPDWKSTLGPVVLTRIGNSDWWFEQSPDD